MNDDAVPVSQLGMYEMSEREHLRDSFQPQLEEDIGGAREAEVFYLGTAVREDSCELKGCAKTRRFSCRSQHEITGIRHAAGATPASFH